MPFKIAACHSEPIPGTSLFAKTIFHLTQDGHRTLCNRPINMKDRAWDVSTDLALLWFARRNRPCKVCEAVRARLEREVAEAAA